MENNEVSRGFKNKVSLSLSHTYTNRHRDSSRKPMTNSVSIVGQHVVVGNALMAPAMEMSSCLRFDSPV